MTKAMIQPPEFFLSKMKDLLGAEYDAFYSSFADIPNRALRINKLKTCVNDFAKLFTATSGAPNMLSNSVPWCKEGFVFSDEIRPSKSLFYRAGLFYIQEPSAMCPVEVLGVKPSDRVLDLCAAPGGKSAQIAGFLADGLLVSNDASPGRSKALVKNLEMAGVTNAIVLTEMPKKIAERFPGFFDKVLVDAPCSGEGMFRRDADAVKAYTANKPDACVKMQREILYYAASMVKSGGRLVYSTCTFNPLENEGVIGWFLENNKNFKVVPINHKTLGVSAGRPEWAGKYTAEELIGTARIWPHIANGEGHYIACLEKIADDDTQNYIKKTNERTPKEFTNFCKEFLKNFDLPIVNHGTGLYAQPPVANIDLKGLRVARSGWYVGEVSNGRFIPSQALAMGIGVKDAVFSVELTIDDAWRYLKGETLATEMVAVDKNKPWVLVSHSGFPLGWARLVQGRLKNHLPTGWVVS